MGAAHASPEVKENCTQPCLKHCTTLTRAKKETAKCSGPCEKHCYSSSSDLSKKRSGDRSKKRSSGRNSTKK